MNIILIFIDFLNWKIFLNLRNTKGGKNGREAI